MEISIGRRNVGRVVFQLYDDITPKTAENFRVLCTGETYSGTIVVPIAENRKLCLAPMKFLKLVVYIAYRIERCQELIQLLCHFDSFRKLLVYNINVDVHINQWFKHRLKTIC